jgi:hypothetical protein
MYLVFKFFLFAPSLRKKWLLLQNILLVRIKNGVRCLYMLLIRTICAEIINNCDSLGFLLEIMHPIILQINIYILSVINQLVEIIWAS